jgi:EmrB/QacA subfamily drug resistance transporter
MTRYQHLITDENRKWWTLGAMCFALFMVMLDNTVVNVALPSIQRDLGASISGLEWAVNGYTLSFGVFLATAGRLGDIFGRRRGFLVGVTVFTLSSIACGVSTSTTMLIVARVFQGLGAAFMMPATLSIVTNAFSPAERGRAIGTWAGVSAVALAIGPVVGGFLTEQVSWQSIFFLNVPVGIVAILATVFAVRESRDHTVDHKLDPLGVGALTISLTALVVALVDGNSWGWSSPEIIALFAAFVVFAGAFMVIEPRVKAPIIDFSFLKSRDFLGANLVGFVVSFAMFGVFFFIALYMQDMRDPVIIESVNEIEDLTTSLSRKIWQKIMVLNQPTRPWSQ